MKKVPIPLDVIIHLPRLCSGAVQMFWILWIVTDVALQHIAEMSPFSRRIRTEAVAALAGSHLRTAEQALNDAIDRGLIVRMMPKGPDKWRYRVPWQEFAGLPSYVGNQANVGMPFAAPAESRNRG
jgi:hypothetical protein